MSLEYPCIYYRRNGLCSYGGDLTDANICVFGPCDHETPSRAALRRMQVETGSLVCLGCGQEHNCGVHGCAILREAVEALAKKDAWISVQDRLPEEGYVVLAIASGCPHANIILKEAYQIAEWCHEGGWILQEFPEWEDAEVTHWMPLPEPPEEVRGNET